MIEVSEIYASVQGEGRYLGRPSIFLRTHRCNLQCRWCDTKYTWDRDDPAFGDFDILSPEDLTSSLMATSKDAGYPRGLVITGGEPLIWARQLFTVIRDYRYLYERATGFPPAIEIETAGTISPAPLLGYWRLHYNVSPKLPSSGNTHIAPERLWNREVLAQLLTRHSDFKLVVSNKYDEEALVRFLYLLEEISIISTSRRALYGRIYLMPEGVTPEEIQANLRKCIDLAAQYGIQVTTRLQIEAYGNERWR